MSAITNELSVLKWFSNKQGKMRASYEHQVTSPYYGREAERAGAAAGGGPRLCR